MKIRLLCCILLVLVSVVNGIELPIATSPQISVSITGFVPNPGTYKLLPVERLSDALKQTEDKVEFQLSPNEEVPEPVTTGVDTNPIPLLRNDDKPKPDYSTQQALRQIRISRNGKEEIYDLFSFYRLGKLDQNPLLRDGDVIYVPAIKDLISVNGCVVFPSEYEFKAGDTLEQAISFAYGALPGADFSAIRLSRYNIQSSGYSLQTLNLVKNPELGSFPLQSGDRIMVPYNSQFREKKIVTLSGEVKLHGEYIISDSTTVWDALQMAGGITTKADLANAVLLNKTFNEEPDAEFERLKQRGMSDLTPLEYSYFRIKSRQAKGKYSLDFSTLISSQGKEQNPILNNGDHIYIPEKMNMVWVSGQVRKPGLVPFKEGENWEYYVDLVGGFANNRSNSGIRVLRAASGNWVKVNRKQVINPGDTIFIPDKMDRLFWTDVKDIVTLAASAVTIFIGVQSLTK